MEGVDGAGLAGTVPTANTLRDRDVRRRIWLARPSVALGWFLVASWLATLVVSLSAALFPVRLDAAKVPRLSGSSHAGLPVRFWTLLLLGTGFVALVLLGPPPTRGTKWFWFWVAPLPLGLGVLAYAVCERVAPPRPARPARPQGGRWSGWAGVGWAFLLGLLVSLVRAGLEWSGVSLPIF